MIISLHVVTSHYIFILARILEKVELSGLEVLISSLEFSNIPSVPKYIRLREALREQMAAWQAHDPLPSEAQLCEAHGVSRTTVRKALDYLMYEGLIYRVQGKGTFVSPPKLAERYIQESSGLFEYLEARGVPLKTRVLDQSIIPASDLLAKNLEIESGEEVLRLVRMRIVDEDVINLAESYVPHALCPGIALEEFRDQSLYRIMREKYGIQIHHGRRLVEAQLSTEEDAQLLGIPPASPLLVVTGTMFDPSGKAVDYGILKNRADRHQVEINVYSEDLNREN